MPLPTFKHASRQLVTAGLRPWLALPGLRYRFSGLREKPVYPMPRAAINALASDDAVRGLSFTFAVIALCARVARADGPVTREAYAAFREAFPLRGAICGKIRQLFTLACREETPPERYIAQIRRGFPEQPELAVALMDRLFRIAAAAGGISRETERVLAGIAHGLSVSAADYAHLYRRHTQALPRDVLEISQDAPAALVKKRYHTLMREVHPDRFASLALSPEVELVLKLRAAEVNAAYRSLSRKVA